MKAKIVNIGSFVVDVAAFAPKFPVEGETVTGNSVKYGPGGKGSNQACAAHRAGAEVFMVTKVGDDFMSEVLYGFYKKEGMATRYVTKTDKAGTGVALIEISGETGENRIIIVKGACGLLSEADVAAAEENIKDCDTVLLQLETNPEAVRTGIKLAKKYGKRLILNPAPPGEFPKELFKEVDFLTPNETEAEYFTGIKINSVENAKKAALKLRGMGVKNVVITLGKNGAYYLGEEGEAHIPTTDLKAVDTTGAGDSFNGAFAVAVSEGKDAVSAIKFANSAASISITREGTSPAMPKREEIDELYERYYR